ncbi:MAG: TolC family protein, partial [Pseudomonadota bacterium]
MSLAFCLICLNQPARAETLAEALELAFKANPSLSGQQARTRAADEGVTQAKAAYGPSIDATANYTYRREVRDDVTGSESEGASSGYAVTLSQPLLTFGRLDADVGIANADRLAAREQLRLIEQSVTAEAVLSYVGVRRDLAIYGVRLQIAALLKEQADFTQKRYHLRAATLTDLEQINNQRQIADALAQEALATLEASANEYRRVVGRYPGELAPLPPSPVLPPLESLLSSADQLSPQNRIAAYSENGARQLVALRRAERMPVVSAQLGASNDPLTQFADDNRAMRSFAGVSVSVPLFRGGQLGSRIREASELAQAARVVREEGRRTV